MGAYADDIYNNRRLMAYTAAAIYGAAAIDGCIEGFLPGDPPFSMLPVFVVLGIVVALLAVGPRLPRRVLALLGPLGVALTAYALATTPGPTDAAVLYALPVLWTTLFFGRRGAIVAIGCVGVAHATALLALPAAVSYPGRWVDVMVSVSGVALVVELLEHRNQVLLRRLAGEARTDALTGLLNRRGFDERAATALAHASRDATPIALVAFDIDHFKSVNDEWGHDAGDQVLARLGELLTSHARDVDVVARQGGEEFAALLPDSDRDGATAFAERIRSALASTRFPGFPTVRLSAGIAAEAGPADLRELLQRADAALYEAKRAGRDRVVVLDGYAGAELVR
jgi:diguanylate cyclase (GGDEF)-like protein